MDRSHRTPAALILIVLLIVSIPLSAAAGDQTGSAGARAIASQMRSWVALANAQEQRMSADGWAAIQSDIHRVGAIANEFERLASNVASIESELQSLESSLGWRKSEMESAQRAHQRAVNTMNREFETARERQRAHNAAVRWHNDNPPDKYDYAAVERYNANAERLKRRQGTLDQAWASLIAKEARTVLPLRLKASKKEREHELVRQRFNKKLAEIDPYIDRGNALINEADTARARVASIVENDPGPTPPGGDGDSDDSDIDRAAARAEMQRIRGRVKLLEAELRKVQIREIKDRLTAQELRELQWTALRAALEDAASLVNGERMGAAVEHFHALTPRGRQRLEAAVSAIKQIVALFLAEKPQSQASAAKSIVDVLAEAQAVLVKVVANADSELGQAAIKEFTFVRDVIKGAARLAQFLADAPAKGRAEGWTLKDMERVGEMLADVFGPFSKPLEIGSGIVKGAAHLGEAYVARESLGHLDIARHMHGKAAQSLGKHLQRYRRRLAELEQALK